MDELEKFEKLKALNSAEATAWELHSVSENKGLYLGIIQQITQERQELLNLTASKKLVDIFSYHNPTADERVIYEEVNKRFLDLVTWIDGKIDFFNSESGKNALRKLADARMSVNAAVALKEKW